MAEKKHISFTMLQIFQEETDEEHPLTATELIQRVEQRLGVTIERRTVYSNIQILRQAGYEISDANNAHKGYYLMERKFEKGEILMLCNAIHASHFINQRQSDELIEKLLSELSKYQQEEFHSAVFLPNRLKSQNKGLLYNIEIISEAIRDGKKLQFSYLRYDDELKKEAYRKEPYIMEPRFIIWQDSRPYLIVTNPKYGSFTHFRIDKIKDPIELDEPVRRLSKTENLEAYRYAENKLFMFAGDTVPVQFRCKNRIIPQLRDILGPDMKVQSENDEYSYVRFKTTEQGAIFLAQQFLDAVELVTPENLRDEMRMTLQEALEQYS